MFDHGTVKDASYGIMSIVDYCRIPRRAWYWYRNQYIKVAAPTWPAPGTAAALKLSASTTTLTSVDGTDAARGGAAPPALLTMRPGPRGRICVRVDL
jgi:hypothetical protein